MMTFDLCKAKPLALALLFAAPAGMAAAGPNCTRDGDFIVVEVSHGADVGNSYIIRRAGAASAAACTKKALKGDRIIGKADDPFYFLKLAAPYLMLDSGTSGTRELVIFDLRSGKQIFQGGYDEASFKADAHGARFFAATQKKATAANCPELAVIKKNGMTPVIDIKARFDVTTGLVTKSNETQCRPTE